MKKMYRQNGNKLLLSMILVTALFWSCSHAVSNSAGDEPPVATEVDLVNKSGSETEIAVEAPPFTEGIFPCSDCHSEIVPNPQRRELVDFHDDISAIFDHDSENRWCLDCHDMNTRDSLKLASGKLLDFKESYKLCGQCHGVKLRDWKVGVHGKRIGEWNGKKEYLLCVHCHNPHSPRFKSLTPEPPPVRQEDISIYKIKIKDDEQE
jgi:hypothetical protein